MKKRELFNRANSIHAVELRGHGFSVPLLEKVVASPVNTLDVSDLSLPDRKLSSLLRVFLKSRIISLNLSGNNIGELSTKILSSIFLTNFTLQKLMLKDSDITLGHFRSLCVSLNCNTTLVNLNLISSIQFGPYTDIIEKELQDNFALLYTTVPRYEFCGDNNLSVAFRNYMHAHFFLRTKVMIDRGNYYILPFNDLTAARLLSGGSAAIGAVLQAMTGFTFCPANLVRDIEAMAMNQLRPAGGMATVILNARNRDLFHSINRIDLS